MRTSTWAAGWRSTTTAARPASRARRTTPCRSTPTTWWPASWTSATRPASSTRCIVSESGRAITAHHSVLVFNVLGAHSFGDVEVPKELPKETPDVIQSLHEAYRNVNKKNYQEVYHDALHYRDQAMSLFSLGFLDLNDSRAGREHRARHGAEDPQAAARPDLRPRRARGAAEDAGRHLLLQLLHVPVGARLLDGAAALPGDAHPPPQRGAHPARGALRHHLRLGRQDRQVHRPARRQGHPRAAPAQRRRLLPRRVPGRRLPGDPRRPAQPLRRHQRRARAARARAAATRSTTSCAATRCARCSPTCSGTSTS